ncbi:MAG: hypothetical protein ACRDLD_02330 [Thermoleophilaceae bacterium]
MADTVRPCGFAPDSVYATWSAGQREAAGRMEARFNSQRHTQLALADEALGHPVTGYADDMLRRAVKRLRRDLEDIADGDLPAAKGSFVRAKLNDVQIEVDRREALAERWAASEEGTHSYSAFRGRGGLLAVREDRATAPSYPLAQLLDWEAWKRGGEFVLNWGTDVERLLDAEPSTTGDDG